MEQQQNPKNLVIDLRRLNNAFITNIRSQATGVTKRVIAIPIEDNFIDETGYTDHNGNVIRTAKIQIKMWPSFDEGKKSDFNLRLDISKAQRDALEQNNPSLAQQLNYANSAYDREISRKLLPYVGNGFEIVPKNVAPEQVETSECTIDESNKDLPF